MKNLALETRSAPVASLIQGSCGEFAPLPPQMMKRPRLVKKQKPDEVDLQGLIMQSFIGPEQDALDMEEADGENILDHETAELLQKKEFIQARDVITRWFGKAPPRWAEGLG